METTGTTGSVPLFSFGKFYYRRLGVGLITVATPLPPFRLIGIGLVRVLVCSLSRYRTLSLIPQTASRLP